MENASKALLIAGGVLITLLVVGALLLMINNMSDYQKSNSQLVAVSQLSDFNEQFTQYVRDDLKGIELISLANKVMDYNTKTGGVGEINYAEKITLTININRANYKQMLGGVDPVVFTQSKYVLDQSGDKNGFYTNITKYRKLEENNSLNNLKKLISRMDGLSSTDPSKKVTVNDIIGTSLKDDGVNRW